MNWYSIFYWVSVADSGKVFFNTMTVILTIAVIAGLIGYLVCFYSAAAQLASYSNKPEENTSYRYWNSLIKPWRRIFTICCFFCFISWIGFIFLPDKKDCLTIIAGGAVGNFITRDSSAKQIPSEVMTLLRDKIREEIKEVHINTVADTLQSKSKEELIKLLKSKSN